jgi:2-polyprenyl-3-methyl-5-hydroxy-6-metoxy-1,4-benzoquinol methylase
LPPDQIEALKELERRNRDQGAAEGYQGYIQILQSSGGAFRLQAEAGTYLRYMSPRMGERVLDAGAGVGRLAVVVAPRVKRLVCVDLSANALQVLESEAKARGIHNVETVQSDLCAIPSSLGPFDSAYSVEVLGLIPSHRERRASVQRLYNLLKPGGKCLVSVSCWNFRTRLAEVKKEGLWGTGEKQMYTYYFTSRELRALLQETGFRDIQLRGLIILPGRITRHLPPSFSFVETWCSMVTPLAGIGRLVIAMGSR